MSETVIANVVLFSSLLALGYCWGRIDGYAKGQGDERKKWRDALR